MHRHRFINVSGAPLAIHVRQPDTTHPEQQDVQHGDALVIHGDLSAHEQGHVVHLHDSCTLLPEWHWEHAGSEDLDPPADEDAATPD